jgi:uncharacterized damage-inducible protein DinB
MPYERSPGLFGRARRCSVRTTAEEKKQKVIRDLASARGKILSAAKALPASQQDEVFLGEWSAKDLLAHLAGWDFTNLQAAKEVLGGRLPSFYDYHDRDWRTYNARLVAKYRIEDFDALLEAVQDSHRQLLEHLESIPADEFVKDRGLRFRGWRVTIAALLRVEASDEEEHYRQQEAFRTRDVPGV